MPSLESSWEAVTHLHCLRHSSQIIFDRSTVLQLFMSSPRSPTAPTLAVLLRLANPELPCRLAFQVLQLMEEPASHVMLLYA